MKDKLCRSDMVEERARKLLTAFRLASPSAFIQGSSEDVLLDGQFDFRRVAEAFEEVCTQLE